MKKMLKGSALLLSMAVLFSACLKNNDSQVNVPAGGLMAFNLSPDAGGIGIKLDGNNLVRTPVFYTNFTGGYLPVYVGNRTAWAFDYYSGVMLTRQTGFNVVDSQYYSLFVVSSDSNFKTVIVNDHLDSLGYEEGYAFVRYINAIADSTLQPEVKLGTGDMNPVAERPAFAAVSAFRKLSAGTAMVSVKGAGGVDVSRPITLEANKVYTVLLLGKPGASGDKSVQIKYIVNGTVDKTAGTAQGS
ncbi:MAG: DUF4397 domain-containing protein [Flavihumibacter sp.]